MSQQTLKQFSLESVALPPADVLAFAAKNPAGTQISLSKSSTIADCYVRTCTAIDGRESVEGISTAAAKAMAAKCKAAGFAVIFDDSSL